VAVDPREASRALALHAGADVALDADGDVRGETGPAGAILVLDFVGSDETLRTAPRCSRSEVT
jgi:threonine dehydrogenase-like Zn-dependent dehydrogenase